MKHLRVLFDLSLFASTNLIKLIFSLILTVFNSFTRIMSALLFRLVLSCSIASSLFEIIINLLNEGEHLDCSMAYHKEQLGVMHICDICAQRITIAFLVPVIKVFKISTIIHHLVFFI